MESQELVDRQIERIFQSESIFVVCYRLESTLRYLATACPGDNAARLRVFIDRTMGPKDSQSLSGSTFKG